jgi:uncharacterized protein YacL
MAVLDYLRSMVRKSSEPAAHGSHLVLHVMRALFVLLMAAVGWHYVEFPVPFLGLYTWMLMAIALAVGTLIVCIDILAPRQKLVIFSGAFFGLLVGVAIAYALSFVVALLVEQWQPPPIVVREGGTFRTVQPEFQRKTVTEYVNLLVGVSMVYVAISFILQTKDDFRFIIPYVEFTKQTKGARPILLDTSVLIDGRIADIIDSGVIESRLIVPRFVLDELQTIADSSDWLKRGRGRRGLDLLQKIQNNRRAEVVLYDSSGREEHGDTEVDQKLMSLAKELSGRVLTNDFNLNKVAQLRGVDVININDLATALKPVVLPGERMMVRLIKPGEEPGQGVGYLEDGTMVVVEGGRGYINKDIEFTVTSALQTSAGKMIFGRLNAA